MKGKTEALIILTPGFPADESDSNCLPLQQALVKILQSLHPACKIHVLTMHYPFRKGTYSWNGIPITAFDGKRRGGLFRYLLWLKVNKAMTQLSNLHQIKGILSFWCGESALFGKWFSQKINIPHYCWILGQDAKKDNRFVLRIKPFPHELVALSDFIQHEFHSSHGIKPTYVIPPGIDTASFGTAPSKKDIDILAAGSLIPLKQYDIFIETIYLLKKSIPGIKAALCGKGPEKDKLQSLIKKYELEDNITLAGEIPHTDVLAMMQRSRILLHPSSFEGFGMVILEALYAGCQVISFTKAMHTEIKNWHIVHNKEEMYAKTRELLLKSESGQAPVMPFTLKDTAEMFSRLFGLY